MKNDTIQTRKWITTCLMALLCFCLVLTGIFFIAPIEAEAATLPSIYFDNEEEFNAYYGYEPLTESTYELTADRTIDNTYCGYIIPSGKNVTINGNGHTIYIIDDDPGRNNRDMTLFKVSSSATLTLNNVNIVVRKFVSTNTYNDFANIIDADLYSVVNVNNCTIDGSENEITRGYLARIAPTATFTATSTTFRNWVMCYGYDAPIVNKGLLTLKGCTFDNENSNYGSNSSSAGAIYQYGTTTYEDGGKSYTYKPRMYISGNTTFDSCRGEKAGAILIEDGGYENYITETNGGQIVFKNCYSEGSGGALRVGATENGTHIYGNIVFQNNRAWGKGGAIYGSNMWIGRQGTSRVTIKDNSARTYGGGIAAIDKVYLGRVDVTGNTAGRDQDYDIAYNSYTSGGGIYTEGLFAVTSTTNISNNKSIGYGGGIYVTSTGTLQIEYMPYIDGNTNTSGEASDIYLSHNADSGASAKIKIINSLHKTADSGTMAVPIGLRVGKTGTAITTGWANAAQAISDVFVSEVSGKALYVNDSNELYVDTGYLVTIDPNDGATTGTSGYTASITWADTASYRPSRTGYTFKGWTTKKDDASTLVLSASNTTYTPTANVTLYGLWEKHTYSITYKLNGGAVEGWTPSNFTASYGDSYMLVPNTTPTRSGYTFTGWTMTYYGLKNGGALGNITIALPEEYIGAVVPFEEPDGITQASITITANWTERTVSSIKITDRKYTVQSYFVGDELKSFNITVTYDNNETANVTVTESMVSNFSTATTTGAKTATITYGGKTATFTYTVSAGYAYTVEHYQQNLEDDNYTLVSDDTETLYGVGTTAAVAKTYEGFTAQSFSQVSINENGTTVVKIYYDRNVYTITFNMQGGSGGTTEVTVKHGQTNFSGLVPPTKAGYTFNGYYTQMNGGGKRWFDEDMAEENPTTTANATVYAYWTERLVEKLTIPAASQNQSYVAGDAFVPFNITVTYDNGETETVQVTASMLDNFSTESALASATATVTHMGKTATFTYTVSAGYAYTVEHYQQNIEDDDYTIVSADTETLYGVGTTAAAAKDYTGFTAQTFEQTAIAEDGSTVVKIYYTRNTYTFTYDLDGGTIEGQSVYTLKYKEPVSLNMNVPTKSGYTFVGYLLTIYMDGTEYTGESPFPISDLSLITYITGDLKITAVWAERQIESISIPAASQNQSYVVDGAFVPFNITVTYDNGESESVEVTEAMLTDFSTASAVTNATATVTYTEGEATKTATFTYSVTNGYAYTVKHYQENLDDEGYTLVEADTQTLYGVGTTAAVAKTYAGFTAQAIEQMTIAEDGSTVVEIRYTRNLYTITLHPENSLEDIVINFKYGEITYADLSEILTQNEPEREGYDFLYWAQSKPNYILGGQPPTNVPLPAYPIPVPDNFERWAYYGMCEVDIIEQPVDVTKTYDGETDTLTVDVSQDGNSDFAVVYQWQISTDGATWNDISGATGSAITVSSVSDSAKYRVQITVYEKEVAENRRSTSATSNEVTVAIGKADQTITLSENEFTYSEGLTIDFADYVDGTGDGTLSFEVSDKNGVAFDFANGVVSNITKAGGTFTLTVNKAASDNYNAATETFTVTLNKGAQTLSVSGTPSAPTWKQNFTVSVSGNKGALSYAITSGNASVDTNGVITANGAGQVRYSVTAAATDLYEAKTQEFSVTFAKAAGNLAPDYELPTGITVCLGKSTNDITLPTGWSFATTTTFNSVGAKNVTAKFTPSDTTNYNAYNVSIVITVNGHVGGTAASCTTDQVCTVCGDVLVEALGHNYTEQVDNTVRTTAANCQECNTYWYDCSRCGASAKNDANATDKWYTSNVAGEHNMSSDWTSENGQHFHKCTVDGCTHTDTKVNCTGGMATCVSPAICSVCQNPYGNVTAHHFYDTSEWGYKGTDGHAHVCEYCGVHDTVVGHTPNVDEATEETAKYCTVCDFVIEQQLNHVHSEGTEWKYNSEYHWHDCVGNDGQVYSKAEHTYDNACDTTCNVCNATRTITHDYTKLEKNDTEHWYVCSVCGSEKANSRTGHSGGTKDCQHKAECATCGQIYGDFGDHAYDTTVWVSVDNEHHAHKCRLCGAYTDMTIHQSEDEATCTEDRLCDACSHKMEDAHGHSYTKQIESPVYLKAEGTDCQSHHTYYYACEHCDASSKDDTDTFFEGVAVGAHKISATWTTEYAEETNAGWHYHACTVDGCDYREDEGDCHGGERTCIALAICSTCQKAYGEYAEHSFGNTWEYKDATGHAHVCTVKGCNEHDEIMAHTPNIPAATEESAQYCTACQYQMAAQLNHTHSPATEWTSNATHHWKACGGCDEHLEEAPHSYDPNNACDTTCEVCNAVREVSHDFTGEWQKDASGHWHVCTKNGCSVTDTKQNHVSAGAATETDPEVCSICGWQIAPALGHTTHTPEAEWQKNETHHWHECTGCDGQELNKAAHEYDNNCDTDCNVCGAPRTVAHDFTGEWQKDASGHWHVCTTNGCSVTDTKQNHESAGAATETNPEVCSVCGWVINPALGHTTHTPETEWQKDDTYHWHECAGCEGQELEKAVHNDGNSDGSCDTCGYAMGTTPPPHTHSHGTTWVTDANEHWNECECGDKANKAAHVDDNGDNKCDTCDYTMPAHDPDTPPVDNPPTDDNDGLGTGAIIGIVVAAVAVVGGGGFAIFWFVIRKRRR